MHGTILDMRDVIMFIAGIFLFLGLIFWGMDAADNKRRAQRAQQDQALTSQLFRMGYRDRDNVEVYLKSTDWYMSDFLKSKTVREKYKEWTK